MILWSTLAFAQHALFEPVQTDLGGGARVDWTSSRLEVTATSRRSGSEGTRAVEELARRAVDLRVTSAALDLPISPGRELRELRKTPLWPSLEPRIGRWIETGNRYYASGRVGVVGALSLVELMKPVTMASAAAHQSEPTGESGVLLDARGVPGVAPCFAPEISGPTGAVYSGRMWLDAAVERPPAVWVSDAADPVAAERVGPKPVVAHVRKAEGCAMVVDAEAADAIRRLEQAGRLGEGTLVVVVTP